MKYRLLGIAMATFIVIAVTSPALALLWFSWRAVIVGALVMTSFFLFGASVLAAGGAMYNPAGTRPINVVIMGWSIAAVCLLVAYFVAGRGLHVKGLQALAGVVVLSWTSVAYPFLPVAWFVVAHPEELRNMMNEKPKIRPTP